ncbi:PREDICTED: regulator of G-protein signaling 20-like [Branchiostoma belcheri]|uniref:Regulator of G-protein signaling 20-like n=1 Tax=Branchiostoma belcheri TaxID=7741 RepID=A0A6P4Y4U0_BRABE|nr:PREDICTED: regulator of G-protein signaling 20-like [Branchiostoma belcheri]XP_019624035.1 PREDICTED: regulator of G-protein signaling 20-like [Branchiostoma belcheri]XP_019624036.1 PREDICTED: regulator of G-protein signaling 20-like [Branchiostoma belcheri]XP_019624037.1 PREDICTED: regulator of G-protein signaling 20-like [Branchiostoma belcheri]XP_019624038.1 PREDICTED: regulator of G-protein signaling 20-like [Branchiostoma belcheri]XP_019624039.1 PREDICTED: regulator of G-protein signal
MRQDRAEGGAHVPQAASSESSPLSRSSSRGVPGSCCLCFCCCCSCSCLSVRGGQDEPSRDNGRQPKSTSSRETRLEEVDEKTASDQPDMEEVNEWGKSFDKMMKSCHGRIIFREFLKTEYSEENMMFWLACEDLKKEKPENQSAIEEKARQIYEDYISILSPKEVSIDSRVREIINRNMVDPTPSTFDEAQQQIYVLMHRDSYPRFLNSKMFKDLLRQVSSEGASS